MSHKATPEQLQFLKDLIARVQPDMILPDKLNKHMASNRISYLLKKQKDPRIKDKFTDKHPQR